MKQRQTYRAFIGLAVLLLSMLACEPVIAIGWEELLFLAVLIAILLGPLLLRFWRALSKLHGKSKQDKE